MLAPAITALQTWFALEGRSSRYCLNIVVLSGFPIRQRLRGQAGGAICRVVRVNPDGLVSFSLKPSQTRSEYSVGATTILSVAMRRAPTYQCKTHSSPASPLTYSRRSSPMLRRRRTPRQARLCDGSSHNRVVQDHLSVTTPRITMVSHSSYLVFSQGMCFERSRTRKRFSQKSCQSRREDGRPRSSLLAKVVLTT